MKDIEFWFSIGSPYTYLSVMRLPRLQQETGVRVLWRPFPLRQIMIEMNNFPYLDKPAKVAYLWQDIARQARKYGLSPNLPAPFPLGGCDLADRVALVAQKEGWIEPYVRQSYLHWLHDGHPAGAEPNLSHSILECKQDPDRVIATAEGGRIESTYQTALHEARERHIFGAPSFVVDGELFWGDDRLNDAIRAAMPAPRGAVVRKAGQSPDPMPTGSQSAPATRTVRLRQPGRTG